MNASKPALRTGHPRPRMTPGVIGAAAFVGAYTMVALLGVIATGNREFLFYLIVMVVLASGVLWTHLRVGFSVPLLWALAIWGGLHMAGGLAPVPVEWPIDGEIRVLYSWWILHTGSSGVLKFDQLVHAYGFGVATLVWWEVLRSLVVARTGERLAPTFGVVLLCVAASTGLGAAIEVIEFAATLLADTNVGGYRNTALDLVANLTGATLVGFVLWARGRKQTRDASVS